jgi:3-hydroxybutyryl-CoA dehydrogenase
MTERPIEHVLVVGYGVMGRGIARSFADAGFRTSVWSRRAAALVDLPAGVEAVAAPPPAVPDFVIETVEEDVAVKKAVYRAIEDAYPPSVILGTNTSGLPLEELCADLAAPERFVGAHYFMPAEVFPMVEVIAGPKTPRAVLDRVAAAMRRTGKDAIVLLRPIAGFLINRLQHAILHEAYAMIEAGVCTPADIDNVAKRLLGPRMCVTGLIEQKDISGLRIHAEAQRAIVPHLAHTGVPARYVQSLVARGELGIRSGKGFYDWTGCDVQAVAAQAARRLSEMFDFLTNGLSPPAPGTTPGARAVEQTEQTT